MMFICRVYVEIISTSGHSRYKGPRKSEKKIVCDRVQAIKQRRDAVFCHSVAKPVEGDTVALAETSASKVKGRHKCGRKRKENTMIVEKPSSKSARGAKTHLEYQEICKSQATIFSLLLHDTGISMNRAAQDMKATLLALGVDIHLSTCIEHIKAAVSNNCVRISPQTPGGFFISFKIEKDVAKLVEILRKRKFPVSA